MRVRSVLLGLVCIAWVGGVVAGFGVAERHAGTPGAPGAAPRSWPAAGNVSRDPSRPTLLLFLHPLCPCSSATIEELARVLAHCGDRLATRVLFVTDPRLGTDWQQGGSWSAVAALPGVTELQDAGGEQARLFGAQTSGQALLFAPDGTLLFAGGLTAGRGHAGDNPGASAVQDLVLHGRGTACTPVFGCALPGAEP